MATFEPLVSFGILAFQTILITAVPKVLTWTINVNFLCNVYISISITYLDSLLSKKNMILVFFCFLNFLSRKYPSAFHVMWQRRRLVEAMAVCLQLSQGADHRSSLSTKPLLSARCDGLASGWKAALMSSPWSESAA